MRESGGIVRKEKSGTVLARKEILGTRPSCPSVLETFHDPEVLLKTMLTTVRARANTTMTLHSSTQLQRCSSEYAS